MILKILLDIAIIIISTIAKMISQALPNIEVIRYYKTFLQLLSGILHTAVNFIYFVVGEAMFPLLRNSLINVNI